MSDEAEKAARKARAEARRSRMTIEVVELGRPKTPPYAYSSPEERLAAAVRLIEYHRALLGRPAPLPRAQWPGETFSCG